MLLAGFVPACRAKTEPTVAQSSCEAELISVNYGAVEGTFLVSWFQELGLDPPPLLQLDIGSSLSLQLLRRRGVGRTRHLRIKQLWVQQEIRESRVEVNKIA
jgi:hypothetical protein